MAIVKFQPYILCQTTIVRTDHIPIVGLMRKRDLTGRCPRWKCILAEYDIEFQSRKGQRHSNTNGMSRMRVDNVVEIVPNVRESDDDEFQFWAREVDDEMSIGPSDNLSKYTEMCMGECEGKAGMELEGEVVTPWGMEQMSWEAAPWATRRCSGPPLKLGCLVATLPCGIG